MYGRVRGVDGWLVVQLVLAALEDFFEAALETGAEAELLLELSRSVKSGQWWDFVAMFFSMVCHCRE